MPNRPARYRPSNRPPASDSRPDATERGYDHKWRKCRAAFLAEHPLCERCDRAGLVVEAVHVHHRDGQGPLGERGYDFENLESLCERCHNSETARNRLRNGQTVS